MNNDTVCDKTSYTPLPHLTYIFTYLFEPEDIVDVSSKLSYSLGGYTVKFIGSAADGLSIKLRDFKTTKRTLIKKTPLIVLVSLDFKVIENKEMYQSPIDFTYDISKTHPGYTHLRPIFPDLLDKGTFRIIDSIPVLKHIPQPQLCGDRNVAIETYTGVSCCWPESALRCMANMRTKHWPGNDVVDKLLATQCFVINRCHAQSKHPDTEWQFILSDAEAILLKETFTVDQLYALKIFKILVDFHLRKMGTRVLKSTHLKSVMFRVCSDVPKQHWLENIGGCLIHLFDVLLSDVKARNVPNFFFPENNMVDHFSEEALKSVEEKLEALRNFPIMAVAILADHHFLPRSWIIGDIIADVELFLGTGDLARSVKTAFVPTTIKIARMYMEERDAGNASLVLQQAYDDLVRADCKASEKVTFQEFVMSILKEEEVEIQQKMAVQVDSDFGTSLVKDVVKLETVGYRLKDLIGEDQASAYANRAVPKEDMETVAKQMTYLDSVALELYSQFKWDDSAHFLRAAVNIGKTGKTTDYINTEEIQDLALKHEIEQQKLRQNKAIDLVLLEVFDHLACCYFSKFQPELCQEFVEEYQELCIQYSSTSTHGPTVILIWQTLGYEDKAMEFRKMYNVPKGILEDGNFMQGILSAAKSLSNCKCEHHPRRAAFQ